MSLGISFNEEFFPIRRMLEAKLFPERKEKVKEKEEEEEE